MRVYRTVVTHAVDFFVARVDYRTASSKLRARERQLQEDFEDGTIERRAERAPKCADVQPGLNFGRRGLSRLHN